MKEFKSKIYTRKGDNGTTSLIGGHRVLKNDIRVEAYGSVDELKAFVGLLYDSIDENDENKYFLKTIMRNLFIIESLLAVDETSDYKNNLSPLPENSVADLENEIDRMNESLPPIKTFILSVGHITISYANVARAICRRIERILVSMNETINIDSFILQYINRLSDYLFTYSRFLALKNGLEDCKIFDDEK